MRGWGDTKDEALDVSRLPAPRRLLSPPRLRRVRDRRGPLPDREGGGFLVARRLSEGWSGYAYYPLTAKPPSCFRESNGC